jgi:hypothetical protein
MFANYIPAVYDVCMDPISKKISLLMDGLEEEIERCKKSLSDDLWKVAESLMELREKRIQNQ